MTQLLEADAPTVRRADAAPPPPDPGQLPAVGAFLCCDMRTRADVHAAMAGCDAVVHLAASYSGQQPPVSDATIFAVKVDGTFDLVHACSAAGVGRWCSPPPWPTAGAGSRSHDYVCHGTTTLFAALEIATGKVTGVCKNRHRHQEFLTFLKHVARAYPERQLHLVMGDYAAHTRVEVHDWRPPTHACTPTSPQPPAPG